ncbi:sodium-dependent neutral amino acid transporter B(0)AT3 isoform X1 [Ceratitis capitata]|uniref:Transporter n=2 Tax=Ceratitis capitata TaxID=7213 RepID=A0A811V6K4_CERCA|nr:sodium-dependent neutral amino acid transporter B(0)AT3 isoform X1 [Ceratitis capitata]XP_012158391.1 sodium-dependent neutral amino acid transporter B(0)AT3 isoform X1 [Ceratitis capitata]XP_012158394.1 sodium-dependent neutral amino acid transporter B(0)AT3 isoform X1 [Ceratitis capitata]XP_012158395.1 sodium-dependent neutral amino acid transporter B(0)AT3 isoform X1 [Ceratitis capitata]XP_020715261.1 sodium-dependent neutral amino acid transporter B(0)AT3 isoform X1 [Ceratitis capitata]
MAATKIIDAPRNGHEMAPLNTRARGDGTHGVTIVLTASQRNSVSSVEIPGEPDRAAWSGKMQFFLSIIGYSVGLGNIWRFPYLCQQNGGGAFLIPFMVMLILEGVPLFLIELGIGQRMRLGALGVWNTIHPWLGGIGISSCIVTLFVALYYNVIITWVFFYLFNSFRYPLPWASCPTNGTVEVEECARSSETAYFWYRTTLDAAPSMDEPGGLKWWIVLCLFLSWTIVFFIVMKGIQSSGKVVYFTSLFPYIVLTIFFIRGITLRGASAGLIHMYTPKVEKLADPTVWLDAATQVFYSFGLAFGSLIAFGSYNPPKNNCVRDVLLVSVCNAITAIYASVVIFAILGFKATVNVDRCIDLNKDILTKHGLLQFKNATMEEYESVLMKIDKSELVSLELEECSLSKQLDNAAEGTGLAFIVITQAIVELPGAPFWAVLFFTMLLSLGLGSQIGILEGMLCTLFDIDIIKRVKKQHVTGVVCLFCFSVGFIFCTGAGEYWLKMFDSFAGTIGLVVVALMETIAVVYVYGHERFTEDIYQMTGYRPGLYWQLTWRYIGPVIMSAILVSSVVFMVIRNPTYGAWNAQLGAVQQSNYPPWVMGIALAMILAGVLPMPIVFLMRSFQCLKVDLDIHQGSIRRNETTASTKEMIDNDDDENDEDDYSGPALGGLVRTRSDFSDDDDEDDQPVTMRSSHLRLNLTAPNRLNVPTSKRSFKMEVFDL